jgi:hypothetical protein
MDKMKKKFKPVVHPPAPKPKGGWEPDIPYKELEFGFEYGAAEVTRMMSDPEKGWVVIGIKTPKLDQAMQIYVTKTGKVRVFYKGEWLSPEALEKSLIGKLLSKLDKE